MKKPALIFFCIFFISFVEAVAAQDIQSPIPSPEQESTEFIFNQQTNRPEIERLKVSYRGLIEEYRAKEKQYQVAKIDFQQLNTLRSLEEALKATREAMVSRTDVLLTYLEILKLELQDSEGVEIQKKNDAITAIEQQIEYLRTFREMALSAQDRDQINALAPEFIEHVDAVEQSGYYGLSLVQIGRLQAVHDKARIIETDIEQLFATEEVAPLAQAQRERGLTQTTESLEEVNVLLRDKIIYTSAEDAKGSLSGLKNDLNTVYSKLSLSIRYLNELLKL